MLGTVQFRTFLDECEDSAHRYIAEIARKFYKLGFEEGIRAALQTSTKAVSCVSYVRV